MLSVKRITRSLIDNQQKIRLVVFISYCFFIIYYTLLCRKVGENHRADLRFMWAYREMIIGHPEWKEDVGYNLKNILFFAPFGFWFPSFGTLRLLQIFRGRSWLLILLAGMIFSFFIEITQYIICCGLCELDDVLCNGFGSLIGFWLYLAVRKELVRYQSRGDRFRE